MTTLTRPWSGTRPTVAHRPRPSYPVLLLAAAALAAISLAVLPDGIAYDPWSWLVWGREALHLGLDTRNAATSMKPLPMGVDTVLALTGGAAPMLWLLISRFAALAGLGIAFRLADRMAGPLAGVLALVGVAASYQYASYLFFTGMSEPMAVATTLASADLVLSGRHRRAFLLLLATSLLRLEAWPFTAAYAAWRLWRDPSPRRVLSGLTALAALPLAWFGTDWLGSRRWLRSAAAASHESQGGPLTTAHPGLATVMETAHLLLAPLAVAALVTFLVALFRQRGSEIWRRLLVLGVAALGWLLITATMAQFRLATGALRYLLPAAGLAAVVGAVGIALFVAELRARAASRSEAHPRVAYVVSIALVVALAGASVPQLIQIADRVRGEEALGHQLSALSRGLRQAVARAGGHDGLAGCGHVATAAFQVPALAWEADLTFEQLDATPAPTGTVVQADGRPPLGPGVTGYHRVAEAGTGAERWVVYRTCS